MKESHIWTWSSKNKAGAWGQFGKFVSQTDAWKRKERGERHTKGTEYFHEPSYDVEMWIAIFSGQAYVCKYI